MSTIQLIATIVGIAVGILTIIEKRELITSVLKKLRGRIAKIKPVDISKRNFLISFSIIGVATSVYIAHPLLRKIVRSIANVEGAALLPGLIVNTESGVVHHFDICSNHLPAAKKQSTVVSDGMKPQIHESKHIHISTLLASKIDGPELESLLINTITKSPTSTHLYRPLIRYWGRIKEYDRIHQFLAANVEFLESKLLQLPDNPRIKKKYVQALSELETRRNRARYLERIAEVSRI